MRITGQITQVYEQVVAKSESTESCQVAVEIDDEFMKQGVLLN